MSTTFYWPSTSLNFQDCITLSESSSTKGQLIGRHWQHPYLHEIHLKYSEVGSTALKQEAWFLPPHLYYTDILELLLPSPAPFVSCFKLCCIESAACGFVLIKCCLLLYYVFFPKWLHMEVSGLAVTTFVLDQRFSAVGKPPVLPGGMDFPQVPLLFLPSTTSC